ncbi:Glycosyltransferase 2-like domain-containing protein [Bordetella muralis]
MIFRRRNQSPPSAESVACSLIRNSDLFDSAWYLDQYPDVLKAGFDPVLHYVRHGALEGRKPGPWFDVDSYCELMGDGVENDNPLLDYLERREVFARKSIQGKRGYSNLADFLKVMLLNPVVSAPFREEDRRCFAVMEGLARHLVGQLNGEQPLKVSVIMPVRNRRQTLPAAIQSVLLQRYSNFELIVIDDASDDGSCALAEKIAESDPRVCVLKFNEHIGVCAARNAGLDNSTGDVIAYLDSDNLWLEDYLGASVSALNRLPLADAVYSGQYVYAEADLSKLSAIRFGPMNVSLLEQHNYIDLNCFVHRRSVIEKKIRFDENLQRLVDWDFILKISDVSKICSIPVLLSKYYLHAAENTITKTVPVGYPTNRILLAREKQKKVSSEIQLSKKVCVIIPSYRALDHLQKCVRSLAPYLANPGFEVVIVDNNSTEDVREYLRGIAGNKIKIVLNRTNYGFSYAVNQGVDRASADADVVILNNDAWCEGDSLEILQQAAYESPDIAITIPRQIVPGGTDNINLHVPYATSSVACDVSLSSHHRNIESVGLFHDGVRVELNFAPFFCAYIKRSIWDICGGLDYENGRHYRSDRIMCDLVRQVHNKRIVYIPDAKVHHAVQISTNTLSKNSEDIENEYRTMLVNNIWPDQLKDELKIRSRPWDCS